MARKDPAFLFYPGDASEDTQFLNRLERGAYFDVLKAQKRFRRFSYDQLKKVLGTDFETVWPALKICLSHEEDMFFIKWVEESIAKRSEYSESRRNNRKGDKSSEKGNISNSHEEDMNNICETSVSHMGNGNGNINVNKEEERGVGEEEGNAPIATITPGAGVLIVPELKAIWTKHRKTYQFDQKKDAQPLRQIGEAIARAEAVSAYEMPGIDRIKQIFEAVVVWSLGHNLYKNFQLSQFEKYFQTICDTFKNAKGEKTSLIGNNLETSQDAAELIKKMYAK
jgi:hypothetical protein